MTNYVTKSDDADWLAIERRAREEAEADLVAMEQTPLEMGAYVAWTIRGYAATLEGISATHRVAQGGEQPETFCGERIPGPSLRITLTPGWIRAQDRCRFCEQGYSIALRQAGAA